MAKKTQKNTQPTVDDLKAPLLAAVGAADLALAGSTRSSPPCASVPGGPHRRQTRVEESRARLTKLQEDLPDAGRRAARAAEHRRAAQGRRGLRRGRDRPPTTSSSSVARPPCERLRSQPALEEAAGRVESYTDQAVELTQEALGTVAIADPRGRRARRQAGRRRAAEEGQKAAGP